MGRREQGGGMSVGQFLKAVDSFSSADAVVVLGGDGSDFARARQGVRLFRQGYAPMVVLSVGSYGNDGSRYSSAQQSLEVVQRLGLPTAATIILFGARSTYDEAVRLRELARQHDWRSLIVVTDLYHAHRAGRTFRTLLPEVASYVSAAPNSRYDAGCWWQSTDGLGHFFSEAFKLAYYWVKYGIAPFG